MNSEPVRKSVDLIEKFSNDGSANGRDSPCSKASKTLSRQQSQSSRRLRALGLPPQWPDPTKYNRRSLFMFTLQNPFRKFLIAAIEHPFWDRTVLFVILVNTITLIFRDPYDIPQFLPESPIRTCWEFLGMIFNIFFLIECICKVVAFGFLFGSKAYLSAAWNWLDFVVVVVGTMELLPISTSAGNLSALRSFRVLRPLRVITRVPQLKFLVVVILQSVPELGNVFGLCGFVWFVFGILGVQLFEGATRGACYEIDSGFSSGIAPCALERKTTDDPIQDLNLCPDSQECLRLGFPPNGGVTNFDNILAAFINIFQVMTQQGWTDILYALQSSLSFQVWIYFVILNFIGPYFVIQLFLVIISKKYAELKAQEGNVDPVKKPTPTPGGKVHPDTAGEDKVDEGMERTESADTGMGIETERSRSLEAGPDGVDRRRGSKQGVSTLEFVFRLARKVRNRIQLIAASTVLEHVVMCAITVNTLLMAIDADCDFCDQSTCSRQKMVLELSNLVFTSIFTFEMTVKLLGFGLYRYLWVMKFMTWLDVAIVASSLAEIPDVLETGRCYMESSPCADYDLCDSGGGTQVLRIVRLLRILKLLSRFTSFQRQLSAVAKTFKSVSWLIFLILIFITIFVILGATLMPGLVLQPWSADNLMRGMRVFVKVPGDDMDPTLFPVPGRVATLRAFERNASKMPWKICFDYGVPSVLEHVQEEGCVWGDTVDSAGYNTPAIVGAIERDHYDQPGICFLTVLGILTTSNWNAQYYSAAINFQPSIIFYYIAWIFLGNWVLFNVFIAILIQGVSEEKTKKFRNQEEQVAERIKMLFFGLTDRELLAKIHEIFDEVDTDHSGLIDLNELEVVLVDKCGVEMAPREIIKMFRKYDADDSGRISKEEFELMIKELLQISQQRLRKRLMATVRDIFGSLSEKKFEQRITEMFRAADSDGSGEIDLKELSDMLVTYDIELTDEDLRKLVKRYDDDGSGHINRQEFAGMIRQLLEEAKHMDAVLAVVNGAVVGKRGSLALAGLAGIAFRKSSQVVHAPHMEESGSLAGIGVEKGCNGAAEHASECEAKEAANGSAHAAGMDNVDLGSRGAGGGSRGSPDSLRPEILGPGLANGYGTSNSHGPAAAEGLTEPPVGGEGSPVGHEVEGVGGGGSGLEPPGPAATGSDQPERGEGPAVGQGEAPEGSRRAERSLFCLGLENPLRRACIATLDYPPGVADSKKLFDNFILVCIMVSSAALAFESPRVGSRSATRRALDGLNVALNLAFLTECALKIVAESFFVYLKSGWSRLDFFIVVTSTLDMVLSWALAGQNVSILKTFRILRILRSLRPLRLIARARSLRLLITALWDSIFPIIGTCAIAIIAFAMCSLLGMQLLRGKMKSCSDPSYLHKWECLANVDDNGVALRWVSTELNWDNLFNGIVSMFILSSQDNWQNYMWQGTDAVSRVEGPMANHNLVIALFYVFCLVVSSFLVLNLVIGVFIEAYYSAAAAMALEEVVVREPRARFQAIEDEIEGPARVAVGDVVGTNAFDMFIAFFIVTNIVTMAFESYKQAAWQSEFAATANYFYSLVFGWECLFKLFAYCPKRYYHAGWNRFDFFIVMISFGGILVDGLGTAIPMDPRTLRVLRLFRVFRILRAFRILKSAKGLTKIVSTLAKSLPALRNLMALLALHFFIFGVLGVSLFGGLCVQAEHAAPGLQAVRCMFSEEVMLDPRANFRDIGHALIALFRVATTDGWSALMYSLLLTPTRKPMSDAMWASFRELNGTVGMPASPPHDLDPMSVVERSLEGWRDAAMVNGTFEPSEQWPYPTDEAAQWAKVAKGILGNCITDEEAAHLESRGLMDCTTLGNARACASTCTDPYSGYAFFFVFTLLSAFFLMQLVIAVLLQQLVSVSDKEETKVRTPGCENLKLKVFGRMHRRWRFSALQKLRRSAMMKKREEPEYSQLPDSDGA